MSSAVLTPPARALLGSLAKACGDSWMPLQADRTQRNREAQTPAFAATPHAAADAQATRDVDPLRDGGIGMAVAPDAASISAAVEGGAEFVTANFSDCSGTHASQVLAGHAAVIAAVSQHGGVRIGLRPRGLDSAGPDLDGVAAPPAFVDLALYLAGNASALRGRDLRLELPGVQSQAEAEAWRCVIDHAAAACQLDAAAVRVTLLLDNVHAAFALDEILQALGERAVAVQLDRRHYVASHIRLFWRQPECVLPDADELANSAAFLGAVCRQQLAACRRRGALPLCDLPWQAADQAPDEVRASRVQAALARAFHQGYGGILADDARQVARAIAVRHEAGSGDRRQGRVSDREPVVAADLLQVARGKITERGVRAQLRTALAYLACRDDVTTRPGTGSCPDRGAARLAHHQLWQWLHHITGILDEGRNIDLPLLDRLLDEEQAALSAGDKTGAAARLRAWLTHDRLPCMDAEAS